MNFQRVLRLWGMIQFYEYSKCSTCREAAVFLEKRGISFQRIAIRETPPTVTELKTMLKQYQGQIRKLLNTSGMDYKAMGLKDKIDSMTVDQVFQLLQKNGNLVKRPFLIGKGKAMVGFKKEEWEAIFK